MALTFEESAFIGLYIQTLLHGITISLAFTAIKSLSRRAGGSYANKLMILVSILLVVFPTVDIAVTIRTNIHLYVRRDPPTDWPRTAFAFTSSLFFSLNMLTADCVLLWRLWVVWNRNIWVTIGPTILFLGGVCVTNAYKTYLPWTSHIASLVVNNWQTATIAVAATFNTLVGGLILLRLWMAARTLSRADSAQTGKIYSFVGAIIAESTAIYAVTALVLVAFFAANHPAHRILTMIWKGVTSIAPLLVIVRVATGRTITEMSESQANGTRMVFASTKSAITASAAQDIESTVPPTKSVVSTSRDAEDDTAEKWNSQSETRF